MLITYADSLGKNLKELKEIVDFHFKEEISSIHILPFYPSSADRGFAPMTYKEVDPTFGTWEDIKAISKDYQLMFDFMINHISQSSAYYQDFVEKKEASPYKDFFIRYSEFWEDGFPTQEQIDQIYKRKPKAPYIDIEFNDGTQDKLWCTFSEEQVDLDVSKKATMDFIRENLLFLADAGASIIRLDAFAYAIKKKNTNCFFIEPDIWDLLKTCKNILEEKNVGVLPEIHEHYSIQLKIAEHDFPVYDFALPMLVLHGLYAGTNKRLNHWLNICPRCQYTTLDTHDGIGVVDVKDLMDEDEVEFTREQLYEKGANVKRKYSSSEYKNLDIYQINCTYYSALGNDDAAYVLARAIQFFAPGIPQVYYVGLLAGENDIELLEKTKNGRDINRHYYSKEEVNKETKRPVVQDILALMRFRNKHQAFNGEIEVDQDIPDNQLRLIWTKDKAKAILHADLKSKQFCIEYTDIESGQWTKLLLPSQKLRPNFHFTAKKNWINDPNGFSFYNGKYHLFYQYNPYGLTWGNMSWGHATSENLIDWEHLPVALWQDQNYDKEGVFSGSAITLDKTHYLYYTGVADSTWREGQVQCMASSSDGINYTKYDQNPILLGDGNHSHPIDFRDPKVWKEGKYLYMVVATKDHIGGKIVVYRGKNHIEFDYFTSFQLPKTGHMWKCPDFFELNGQQILITSVMGVEAFDKTSDREELSYIAPVQLDYNTGLTAMKSLQRIDYGTDFYAPQTMQDLDGRRIMIGWMRMEKPLTPITSWTGMMSLPRVIDYRKGKIYYQPDARIFKTKEKISMIHKSTSLHQMKYLNSKTYVLEVEQSASKTVTIQLGEGKNLKMTYDAMDKSLALYRRKNVHGNIDSYETPSCDSERLYLQIIVDVSVVEVYLNHGEYVISGVFLDQESNYLEIETEDGNAIIETYEIKKALNP